MQEAFIILGGHRTGTSVLSGTLNKLGIEQGNLQTAGNPGDRFEHPTIVNFHNRLLTLLGLAWDDLTPMPPLWHESSRVSPFVLELAEFIRREFGNAPRWSVKDPRLCRLLPIWLMVLERLEIVPRFLIVFRPFVEVAASLHERHGFSGEKSASLSADHLLRAEHLTRQYSRSFLSYEDLLRNPFGTLEECWRALDLPWPFKEESFVESASGLIQPQLQHHWGAMSQADVDLGSLAPLIAELEAYLRECTGQTCLDRAEEFDRLRYKLLNPEAGELQDRLDQQMALLKEQSQILEERTKWLQIQAKDVHSLRDVVLRLVQDVKVLKKDVKRLKRGGPLRHYTNLGVQAIRSPHLAVNAIRRRFMPKEDSSPIPKALDQSGAKETGAELSRERIESIRFAECDEPRVSVIIPVYKQIPVTVQCLEALAMHGAGMPFEVIVVDDGSGKEASVLSSITGLRIVRNETNRGFIYTCNLGSQEARGEFLLFLNNDTIVTEGWMDALVKTFETFDNVGLVGGKLVFPDGTVQEAGGIVWRDGSAWNYGRGKHPESPSLNYAREVDYCSGACLMTRKGLFEQLGRFDDYFSPAYYEDTDLAFRVRAAGYAVYYQPTCTVYHDEGTTSGTDIGSGVKKHQAINAQRFYSRWKDTLRDHRENGDLPEFEKERNVQHRCLFLDHRMLTPDQDSGSVRTVNMLSILQDLGYKITFVPDNLAHQSPYTEHLQAMGIEVLYGPHVSSIESHLQSAGDQYDLVILSRLQVAAKHIKAVRRYCRKAQIVFDTVDLHFLREMREAKFDGSIGQTQASLTRNRELQVARLANQTIVVSPYEAELLGKEAPDLDVHVISNIHEIRCYNTPFADRRDIFFIGGFEHRPNVDAVLWFTRDVLPLIKTRIPRIKFHIIGSKAPLEILELNSESTPVHGFVPDAEPLFQECRMSVAPLRYGAGVKGKVNHSLARGLPCVATSMAAEGMYLKDGVDILIADDPSSFADAVVRLYQDERLWYSLSKGGLSNIEKYFSFGAAAEALKRLCVRNPVLARAHEVTKGPLQKAEMR